MLNFKLNKMKGLIFLKHFILNRKSWKVRYYDGRLTGKLHRSEAIELAKIFGGKIIFDPKTK